MSLCETGIRLLQVANFLKFLVLPSPDFQLQLKVKLRPGDIFIISKALISS